MKLSRLISLSMTLVGGAAAVRVLQKRRAWERENIQASICMDYEDLAAAAIRAGTSLETLAARVREAGATHVSLPEYTLQRLLENGRLAPRAPASPIKDPSPVGHWNYVYGDAALTGFLAEELAARLPYTAPQLLKDGTLAFAGDLRTIGEIGLGFDEDSADLLAGAGLEIVPRPVSYDWPEKLLIERTLAQAAVLGCWVAFDGKMIVGHEMHLEETLAAMEKEGLKLVYFAESRHQKGDWFVAKRRAPEIVLAHQFSPEDMIPLDFHAAAHNWAHFARERGIRFCYVHFFRVLHATEPLEGLHYLSHLKSSLEEAGFVVSREPAPPAPIPTPDAQSLSTVGLATAGIAAAAAAQSFRLPEAAAIPLALAGGAAALALPHLEQRRQRRPAGHDHGHGHHHHPHDHNHDHDHDHDDDHDHGPDLEALYPPSYTPKLLALGAASLAPLIAAAPSYDGNRKSSWLTGLLFQAGAAAALAAATSGKDYHLRIEEYRGLNLDWLLPLAAASTHLPTRPLRLTALAGLAGLWGLANSRRLDPLAVFDPGYAEGHTHHISAAQRLVGDTVMALGPRPARKWAGLAPLAGAAAVVADRRGSKAGTVLSVFLGAAGGMFGLVGFRRAERALDVTMREALPSFAAGAAAGLVLLLTDRDA